MIRLRALGQCVFEVGTHRVTPDSDVLFALLLVLASRDGQAVPRDELLDLLWPDSDQTNARHRLRQALYQLKRLGAPLTTPDSAINLRPSDVEIDYVECRRNREVLPPLSRLFGPSNSYRGMYRGSRSHSQGG